MALWSSPQSSLRFRSPDALFPLTLPLETMFLPSLRSQGPFCPRGYCEGKAVERDKAFLVGQVLSLLVLCPRQPYDLCGAPCPGMLWAIGVLWAVLELNQHVSQKVYG